MNVVMSSEGRVRRGAGHRRARHVRSRRVERAARSRGEGHARARRAQQRDRSASDAVSAQRAARDAQRGKAARASPAVRGAWRSTSIDLDRGRRGRDRRGGRRLEVFDTFEENALAKARYFRALHRACRRSPTIPGSRSMRLAAARRAEQAVERASGSDRPGARRREQSSAARAIAAEWRSSRALRVRCGVSSTASRELVVRGEVHGAHRRRRRVVRTGSGTIRIFSWTSSGRRLAEATVAEKERVSHRARAFAALLWSLRRVRMVASRWIARSGAS